MDLPAGHTVRAPRLSDAESIYQLAVSYFQEILGRTPVTLTEVNELLTTATFDAERDGWLIHDDTGQAVGYGFVMPGGDRRFVQQTVIATDPDLGAWLLDTAVARARQMGGENGVPEVTIEAGMFRPDTAYRELVSAHGFEFGTTYHQMRIDHPGPLPIPDPPAGTTLRIGDTEEGRRAAHAVMVAAFAGQDSAAIRPYDEWVETHENRSEFDWTQLVTVERDGRALAAIDCNNSYVETDNCGYVGRLGVLPEARGLGLGRYLLLHAFATDAGAGLAGTMLHVDTNNPTPALGLYESVGMRAVEIADQWERTLPSL